MRLATPPTLITLLLSLTPLLAAAELSHIPHPHRQLDLSRRAGAAFNFTETAAQSVELGHQATSSVAAAVPTETEADVTTSSTPVAAATTSTQADVVQTSSSVQQQQSQVVVTSSSVVPTTAAAVTSSSAVASDVVDTVTVSNVQSTVAPVTVTTTSSTSTPAQASTSTSTTTIAPQISTIKSTVVPSTALPTSSAPNLVKSTATRSTATSSASAAAASGGSSKLSVGKTAMIAIIVVASVIVGALAIWTIIRKWKLGPSKKFDERMQPLDFSPHAGAPDPFLEKTRNRYSGGSLSEADRQRRQFVSELDADEQEKYAGGYHDHSNNYLHGVPSHDFTPAEGGIASSNYSPPMGSYEPYGYAPQVQQDYTVHADETVGGTGYADLRRGPSTVGTNFAGMGAGAGGLQAASAPPVPAMPSQYHDEHEERMYGAGSQEGHGSGLMREPSLGRPTKGEGPYFAASQFGQGQRY